jgi:hypothetical protein
MSDVVTTGAEVTLDAIGRVLRRRNMIQVRSVRDRLFVSKDGDTVTIQRIATRQLVRYSQRFDLRGLSPIQQDSLVRAASASTDLVRIRFAEDQLEICLDLFVGRESVLCEHLLFEALQAFLGRAREVRSVVERSIGRPLYASA